ncbi:MAG TPA: hypothetical protein VFY03_08990, partial [Woeseiaceae bacterium]|nr:hypothetical protein [Woeseiaceae bacterium]
LRYRQRPSNYWCEAVDFAAETVYKLVARADSTGTPAESTSISIRLEGDDPAVYIGSQYWHSAENGVIEWHGRLDANNALTASFIVPLTGSVIGTFETNSGSYRVSESQYSNYILCKVDVTLPATRID